MPIRINCFAKNDQESTAYWIRFLLDCCLFKNRAAVEDQFASARLEEFCDCGCNSFSLAQTAPEQVLRIAEAGNYGLVYEVKFRDLNATSEQRWFEILLFADATGHLKRMDVEYLGNCLPIPKVMLLEQTQFYVFESERLITEE